MLEACDVDLRAGDLERVHQLGDSLHLPRQCRTGNVSVEVLLPKGGHGLQLSYSGWSTVLGVDADGGTPDGDFTDKGGGRVCPAVPIWLFAAMAGAVSNLICEADNELRPLRQVLAQT